MSRYRFMKVRRGIGIFLVLLIMLSIFPMNALAAPILENGGRPLTGSSIGSIGNLTENRPEDNGEKGEPFKVSQLLAYSELGGTVTQTVYMDAPVLDALPPLTNTDQFTVSASSKPGATVTLSMSQEGGPSAAKGSATADDLGRFSLPVKVPGSGTYSFTATSELNGSVSLESSPVTTTVDITPPGQVTQITSLHPAYNAIKLQWNAPADPDLDHYFIDRNGQLIATVQTTDFTDTDLAEGTTYCYEITAVDHAGNQSQTSKLCAGTLFSKQIAKLIHWWDTYGPQREIAFSRDGSTVVYKDEDEDWQSIGGVFLYVSDVASGQTKKIGLTETGEPGTYGYNYNPAVNANGQVIAFASVGSQYNSDIYVYDRSTGELTNITDDPSVPDHDYDCEEPSISADGNLIAYMCANVIYVYNRTTGESTKISGNDVAYEPVISADGSTVAFGAYPLTNKYNELRLVLVIYDMAAGKFVKELDTGSPGMGNLSINDNGKFVAYTSSTQQNSRQFNLHVYDRDQDKVNDVSNPQTDGKSFSLTSLSADGKYVLANYSAGSTALEAPRSQGAALFNHAENQWIRDIGSSAIDTLRARMNGTADQFVMEEENAIYMECSTNGGGCGQPQTVDPIDAVSWTAPDDKVMAGEIMPGTPLTIHAAGLTGLQLQADISYTLFNGTDPQHATVALTEDAGAPGSYSGIFEIPEGASAITALQAELSDHSFAKPAAKLIPVRIGGNVDVTIHTEHPAALSGLALVFSSRTVHMPDQTLLLTGGVTHYTVSLPHGADYTVQLKKGDEVVVQKNDEAVESGTSSPLDLSPVFPASLTVRVANVIFNRLPHVILTDADSGQQLGDVVVSASSGSGVYSAVLSGQKEGERINVRMEGDPVYFLPDPQEITLLPWDNQIDMQLEYESTIVRFSDYHFTKFNNRMLPLDNEMNLEVWAKPGSNVLATVQYQARDSEGQLGAKESEVALSEGSASPVTGFSVYTGTFRIQPGISSIESYTVKVNGLDMPAVHPIHLPVMGQLAVSIPNPLKGEQPDWKGLSIGILGSDSSYYRYPQQVNGSGVYKFDLPGNQSFRIAAYHNGTEFTRTDLIDVKNGEVIDLSLSPSFPAVLSGVTVDQDGKPLAHESLTLLAADGTQLSSAVSGGDGTFTLTGAMTGLTVTLKAVDDGANKATVIQKITMASDSTITRTTVKMMDIPKSTVSGTVLKADGQPAADVRIIASIVHDGMVIPFSAQADHNGHYSMAMPKGTVTVHAESDYLTYSEASTGQVEEGKPLLLDLTLIRHVASIDVKLYSKYIDGSWEGPMDLDWRVEAHFGFHADHQVVSWGNPLEVRANPGETVRVCVNGGQMNLPADCQNVVIDAKRQGTAEFRLQQEGGSVTGTVDGSEGGFRATFYNLNSNGLIVSTQEVSRSDSDTFDVQLKKSGSYKLNIKDSKGNYALWKTFELADGQTLDLGSLHLEPIGLFEGQSGNGIRAMPDRLSAGGTAEVDVSFANNSRQAKQVSGTSVHIAIPQGLSFVDHSLSVNGQAMDAAVENGILTVPVGTGGVISPGDQGRIQFQVKADPQETEEPAYIAASIDYTDASEAIEESLGTAEIDRTLITLEAPPYLTSLIVPLSGIAPAGSSVTVYDGQTEVGQAAASSAGFWTLEAHLPETGSTGDYHHLRADSVSGDDRESTGETLVRFDENRAQLVSVTMSQPDGRVVTFDPSKGVARFPYVYIGGGFIFKLGFKNPERITHVRVYMNDTMADATNHNGMFEAYVNPYKPGPIWVDYDVLPDLNQEYAVPNEQQVKDSLPPEWRNYKITNLSLPADNGSAGTNEPSISLEADLSSDVHAAVNYTFSKADYTATESDLARVQAYGEQVYGLEIGQQLDGDTLNFTISAYIPESAIPSGASSAAIQMLMRAIAEKPAVNLAAKPKPVQIAGLLPGKAFFKVAGKFSLHLLESNGETIWDVYGAYGKLKTVAEAMGEEAFTRLNPLLDMAASLCNPELKKYYTDQIESEVSEIIATKIAQRMFDILGDAIETDSLGMAVFVGVTTNKAGDMLGQVVEDDIHQLTEQLQHASKACGNGRPLIFWPKDSKAPLHPHAVPVFTQDPSGYVYEGIPSNRLGGVTAKAMVWDSASSAWKLWDATWFEQDNPMESDANGQYGWFVPDGTWKVRFTKDGYLTADSSSMEVPPPRMNINVGMISYEAPKVVSEWAAPGGGSLKIAFSKPMLIDSFRSGELIVTDEDGSDSTVTGSVYGINAEKTADNSEAAMSVQFTPDTPLTVGHTYQIAVTQAAADYAHVSLSKDDVRKVTIQADDLTPPADPGNPSAYTNNSQIALTWTDPADLDTDKIRITWKKEGSAETPSRMDVAKGVQWAELDNLKAGTTYEITIAAVDEAGNASSGAALTSSTYGSSVNAPSNVSNLVATPGAKDIKLTWSDPAAVNMSKVVITWQEAAGTGTVHSGEAIKGDQIYTISGLKSDTVYQMTATAVDTDGMQSLPQTLSVRTLQESSSNTGSGPASASNSDTNSSNGTTVQLSADSGKTAAFDDRLILTYGKGTFTNESIVTLAEDKPGTSAIAAGYTEVSNAYTLSGAGKLQIAQPFAISIAWVAAALNGMDPRRLGIYRQSEQDPQKWNYVGGILIDGENRIEANIGQLGTYAVLLYDHPFKDMNGHWSRQAVDVQVSRHILSGMNDGYFEPNRAITRAELAAMLVKYLTHGEIDGNAASGASAFSDVKPNAWYAAYIEKASELRLINGYNGRFRPDDPVTREEMIVMLMRGFEIQANGDADAEYLQRFSDAGDIANWGKAELSWAAAHDILSGYEDHTLRPQTLTTRAEAATVMLRLMNEMNLIVKK